MLSSYSILFLFSVLLLSAVNDLNDPSAGPLVQITYCNLILPEYLISTLLNPRWTPRHTHRPRKRKIDPKLPLLLSLVVRLITPLVILSGSTAPPLLIPFNSNFSELDGRRLAHLFCFFLNFSYIFAEYSDSYIVNICGTVGSPFTRVPFAGATTPKILYLVVDVLGPVATL